MKERGHTPMANLNLELEMLKQHVFFKVKEGVYSQNLLNNLNQIQLSPPMPKTHIPKKEDDQP